MGEIINEPGITFKEIEKDNLFYIEKSGIRSDLGEGFKSVEFITLVNKNEILFVEAKTGCPNPKNKSDAVGFDKFYNDIAEKFIDSLSIFTAGLLDRIDNKEFGSEILSLKNLKKIHITFVLVITSEEIEEEWLRSPYEELVNRTIKTRKIWNIRIKVLNKKLAIKCGLADG